MLNLHWIKTRQGAACLLKTVDFGVITWQGVYLIWHEGKDKKVVKIGHGDIRARILDDRADRSITRFAKKGPLYVTWAFVSADEQAGVERYLIRSLDPIVKAAPPNALPIVVNLPW